MTFIRHLITFSTLSLLIFSCKNEEKQMIIDENLFNIIDSYIDENPLKKPIEKDLFKNGFSHPSYQIYFDVKNRDTLMSIIQTPHFNDLELGTSIDKSGEEIHKSISTNGFLSYKNEFPLVFFGLENYSKGNNIKQYLNKTIPDSLKFNRENFHIKYNRWDYKIVQGTFEKLISEFNIHSHPNTKN